MPNTGKSQGRPVLKQEIQFCRSADGTRIAYAVVGEGPPLIKAANWITHLDHDLSSPAWGPWLALLARRHTLIPYDPRGCGLSDRSAVRFPFEKYIQDLEAVAEAARLPRLDLFGFAGGEAIAVAYAARAPERVRNMVLFGPFIRGRFARARTPAQMAEEGLLLQLMEAGWGRDDPSFRNLFVSRFMPDSTPRQSDLAEYHEHLVRQANGRLGGPPE